MIGNIVLAVDPLGLALGIVMAFVGIATLVAREAVAQGLAREYSQRESPSWAPGFFQKRFGIRETRVMSVLLGAILIAVACWFVIGSAF